jgi:predicted MFS family arabinose efflux permease
LTRTRLTWLVYCQLALWAYFLYGFGPSVNLLRDDLGVSRAVGALHGTALAVGAVLAGLSGRWLVGRFGRGPLLWGGVVGMCLGIVGYCGAHVLALTLLAALVCGTCGAVIVNTANAALMEGHGTRGPAALSEANALAAVVGACAPLIIGGCVLVGLGWRAGLLLTLVLAVGVAVAFRGVKLPAPHPVDPADHPGGAHTLPRAYWLTWGVLVCTIGVEFCLSLWATDLLGSRDDLSPGVATAIWSGLLVGVGVSRFVGSRLTAHYSVDAVLTVALLVLLSGFGVFWLTSTPWVACAGLVVAGLGLGVQYPLTISRAIAASNGRSDLAAARASLGSGLAVAAGPFVLAVLADRYGTHGAFLLVPLLVGAALLMLTLSRPGSSQPMPKVAIPAR